MMVRGFGPVDNPKAIRIPSAALCVEEGSVWIRTTMLGGEEVIFRLIDLGKK